MILSYHMIKPSELKKQEFFSFILLCDGYVVCAADRKRGTTYILHTTRPIKDKLSYAYLCIRKIPVG
jgi:hypothetical protein